MATKTIKNILLLPVFLIFVIFVGLIYMAISIVNYFVGKHGTEEDYYGE